MEDQIIISKSERKILIITGLLSAIASSSFFFLTLFYFVKIGLYLGIIFSLPIGIIVFILILKSNRKSHYYTDTKSETKMRIGNGFYVSIFLIIYMLIFFYYVNFYNNKIILPNYIPLIIYIIFLTVGLYSEFTQPFSLFKKQNKRKRFLRTIIFCILMIIVIYLVFLIFRINAEDIKEVIGINTHSIFLSLMFILGILTQTFLFIKDRFEKEDIAAFIMGIVISFVFTLGIWVEDIKNLFYPSFIIFAVVFSALITEFFKDKILHRINEAILLVWFMLFWYVYLSKFSPNLYLIIIFAIPTILVVLISFMNFVLTFRWKVFLYISYLLILIILTVIQINPNNIAFFFSGESSNSENIFNLFFSGMIFMYAITHLWFILAMIPMRSDKQTWKDRHGEIKEHAKILSDYFSGCQFSIMTHLMIIVLLGNFLFINYYFNFLSIPFVISLGIIITQFLSIKKKAIIIQ